MYVEIQWDMFVASIMMCVSGRLILTEYITRGIEIQGNVINNWADLTNKN